MSVYRYYLPGVDAAAVTDDTLSKLGLSDRLRDCPLQPRRGRIEVTAFHSNGPDGSSGAMVTPQPADRSGAKVLKAGEFDAHKSLRGNYWLVWEKANPPTPQGLVRCETVPGYDVRLGDDQFWHCPTIRTCLTSTSLPRCYSRLNGELTANLLPQYDAIWKKSGLWTIRLLEEHRDTSNVDFLGHEAAFDAAIESLALNYRVSDEEISLLRLFTTENIEEVIDAAINLHWLDECQSDQKKTSTWLERSQTLRNSLRGVMESTPDTNPAEQTSS